MLNGFMEVQEVMARLEIARPTVYRYVKEGRLKLYHAATSRKSLFSVEEVERLATVKVATRPNERHIKDIMEPSEAELAEALAAFEEGDEETELYNLDDMRIMAAEMLASFRANRQRASA